MAFRNFLPYSVVGTGLWATTFCVLGYIFWRSFDRVVDIAGRAIFGFGLAVAVIVGAVVVYRRRAQIWAWLVEHERHPLLRPLFAVGRSLQRRVIAPWPGRSPPEARFLGTPCPPRARARAPTTLALGGVGLYVSALPVVLSGETWGPTRSTESCSIGVSAANERGVTAAKTRVVGSYPACGHARDSPPPWSCPSGSPSRSSRAAMASGSYTWRAGGQGWNQRPRPASPSSTPRLFFFSRGTPPTATAWLAARSCSRAARAYSARAGTGSDCPRCGRWSLAHLPARALWSAVLRRLRHGRGASSAGWRLSPWSHPHRHMMRSPRRRQEQTAVAARR